MRIGARIFDRSVRDRLDADLTRLVDEHHVHHPLDPGAALQTVRAQLSGRAEIVDDALRLAMEHGVIEADGGVVRRAGWVPRLLGKPGGAQDVARRRTSGGWCRAAKSR